MPDIQVKNYEHYNRAFPDWDDPIKGKFVRNKKHYYELCKKYNLIPSEMAGEIARKRQETLAGHKYKPSPEVEEFLKFVQDKTDSRGKVKLDDKAINFMIERNIIQDMDKVEAQLKECGVCS